MTGDSVADQDFTSAAKQELMNLLLQIESENRFALTSFRVNWDKSSRSYQKTVRCTQFATIEKLVLDRC